MTVFELKETSSVCKILWRGVPPDKCFLHKEQPPVVHLNLFLVLGMDRKQQSLVQLPHTLSPAPAPFQCTLGVAMPEKRFSLSPVPASPFLERNPIQDNALLVRKGERRRYSNRTALQRSQNHPLPHFRLPRGVRSVSARLPPQQRVQMSSRRTEKQQKVKCWVVLCEPGWQRPPSAARAAHSASQKVIQALAKLRNESAGLLIHKFHIQQHKRVN